MKDPVKTGRELLDEIDSTQSPEPALWWLGQSGFAIKSYDMVFYVDVCLGEPEGRTRIAAAPLEGAQIENADLLLSTHQGRAHLEGSTTAAILEASPRARLVIPKSAAEYARGLGVPYERMTTTDSDLRVEYFKRGLYGRVYAVPSAHPELDWTPLGGYPYLGYLIRFGGITIYHAGDCRGYEGLVDRLRPYRVTVALLPINGNENLDGVAAARLACEIGARWVVPMHYGTFAEQTTDVDRFIDHMLGFHPAVGLKVFEPGERWVVPCDG